MAGGDASSSSSAPCVPSPFLGLLEGGAATPKLKMERFFFCSSARCSAVSTASRRPSARDVAGDVDEGDVDEDDADEDGNAMNDGRGARSHDFALRPDLHGCDGFYVARWVRERGPGWDP